MRLVNAVKKCTSIPAERFNLVNRGLLVNDAIADIVVLNMEKISDHGSHGCFALPSGIIYVLPNGKVVVENGKPTRVRP